MSERSLFPVRKPGARAAGMVGAAGLMLAVAPVASAHALPVNTTADAPKTPTTDPDAPTATVKPHVEVLPDYGFAKIRVGVQIKTGAYVPAGTTTAGSTVTLTETGPDAPTPIVSTCVTDASTQVGTTTYCTVFGGLNPGVRRAALRRAATASKLTARERALVTDPGMYTALPGDSVAITQTTVADPALVIDPVLQTSPPCVLPVGGGVTCDDPDVIFNDDGLPPRAVGDTATSSHGRTVDIDVLANDVTHGAPATIASFVRPAHGHVTIDPATTATPRQTLTYTPAAGYSGTDRFSYVLSTANGTSTGTVAITVTAAPTTSASTTLTPTAPATTNESAVAATSSAAAAASSSSTSAALPNTGGHVQGEAEAGFGLLGIGALLTMLGMRRRPRGTHAG